MDSRQTRSRIASSRTTAVGAVILVAFQTHTRGVAASSDRAFFTVDDGNTWFANDAAKIPPFDKDGKQAVRAFVYRCADGTTFVNHVQRYKPEAKRVLEVQAKRTNATEKQSPISADVAGALATGR